MEVSQPFVPRLLGALRDWRGSGSTMVSPWLVIVLLIVVVQPSQGMRPHGGPNYTHMGAIAEQPVAAGGHRVSKNPGEGHMEAVAAVGVGVSGSAESAMSDGRATADGSVVRLGLDGSDSIQAEVEDISDEELRYAARVTAMLVGETQYGASYSALESDWDG